MREDLTLLPEVEARRALRGHRVQYSLLAPYGRWAGRGVLRVLRVKIDEEWARVTVGYESYEQLEARP